MMVSFVAAALLISVLGTEAQNHNPNPPPPPPGYPDSQSYSVPTNYNPQVSDPKPDSFPASAQVSYSGPPGNPGYSNNAYFGNPSPQYPPPPPWFPRQFGPPDLHEFEKMIASVFDKSLNFFERIMKGVRKKHWWRNHQYSGPPQYYPSPPQGYAGPSQSYGGQPQGYFNPSQGYSGPPQSYPQQPSSFPAQPSGSAVPPPSGTQQSNYGSPPNLAYNYYDSVPQQQLFPGQSLPAAGADASALPSPQYSPGPAPFVPPPSAPVVSVSSGDVKLPGNSTLPASGTPGNSS